MTKVLKCDCKHEYQDRAHGPGLRVHNKAQGPNNTVIWRCTVCGREVYD